MLMAEASEVGDLASTSHSAPYGPVDGGWDVGPWWPTAPGSCWRWNLRKVPLLSAMPIATRSVASKRLFGASNTDLSAPECPLITGRCINVAIELAGWVGGWGLGQEPELAVLVHGGRHGIGLPVVVMAITDIETLGKI